MKNSAVYKYILSFDEIDRTMISLAGGKGANLGEMIKAGFPVPDGFCLTTEAYKLFATDLALENAEAPDARRLLAERSLPDDCLSELREMLGRYPSDALFSVRSSATAEDLPYASFAGQQDTYLNVPKSEIPKAVKDCFLSLYTDRAVSYRKQNNIKKPEMSVVIQRMVSSDASGVMFTVDPVTQRRNTLVIDAIFGLGEAIVSGLVSPDHIEYDKEKKAVSKTAIARKAFAIRPQKGGGTRKEELNSTEPVLTASQITELADLGIKLEAHYHHPQDVEWAIEDGKLYILQTRGITSLYPAPEERKDGRFHFYYNLGYQQMNTKAMPAMALDALLGATNIMESELSEYRSTVLYKIGQHLFVDFSMLLWIRPLRRTILEKLLPNIDPLVRSALDELLARNNKLQRPPLALTRIARKVFPAIPKYLQATNPREKAEEAERKLRQKSDEAIRNIEQAPVSPDALSVIFRNVMVFSMFTDPFLPMVLSGLLALKRLEKLEKELGRPGKWTGEIQKGSAGNIVTEMGLHVQDLAAFVAADPSLAEILESTDIQTHKKLLSLEGDFFDCYRSFMAKYGFRGAGELDISTKRWNDDPSAIISQILSLAREPEAGKHRISYAEKMKAKQAAGEELVMTAERELGKGSAEKARQLLEKYNSYFPYREHFKYYWMRIFSAARAKLLTIGEQLVRQGVIKEKEDVMHLQMKEVQDVLRAPVDLEALIDERKLELERVRRLTPPRVITSEGEVLMGGIRRDGIPENALVGAGVSAGSVEGIARIVLDPVNAAIGKGEVLVAPFTDPGWTPLFVDAAAVVTEIGGTLTHGAVVAREYGIPCVVGVTDATKKIINGAKIRVDGTTGLIELL